MPSLREAATAPSVGMDLTRLEALLTFLAERLAAEDYAEAEALLYAAVDPVYAARRNRAAA
jgi:hypothetical protein